MLEQLVALTRHLNKELVLQVLGNIWVFEAIIVLDSLELVYIITVGLLKVFLVLAEEHYCFFSELLDDHIEE
tara:strand:- start:26 stop:241 length:216 start_codon:yes stop_codon:yes gene_type:complete